MVREGARYDGADRTAQEVLGYNAQGVRDRPQTRMNHVLRHGDGRRGKSDRGDCRQHENHILDRPPREEMEGAEIQEGRENGGDRGHIEPGLDFPFHPPIRDPSAQRRADDADDHDSAGQKGGFLQGDPLHPHEIGWKKSGKGGGDEHHPCESQVRQKQGRGPGEFPHDVHLVHFLLLGFGDPRCRSFAHRLVEPDGLIIFHKEKQDGDDQTREGDDPKGMAPSPVGSNKASRQEAAGHTDGDGGVPDPDQKGALLLGVESRYHRRPAGGVTRLSQTDGGAGREKLAKVLRKSTGHRSQAP